MTNIFRCVKTNKLDKQYLRICAVHRLLDKQAINKECAVRLLVERSVPKPQALVELWLNHPKVNFS